MPEMLKLGIVLMSVSLVAAVALGLVNGQTAPVIAVQKEMARQAAMTAIASSLSPGDSLAFDSIEVEGLENPYAGVNEALEVVRVSAPPDPEALGYLFVAYGKGYSSTIQTMVAVDPEGVITGSTILYQGETPGLGANVAQPDRLIGRLAGLTGGECLLKKDGGTIDAMTGCTITSRAVVGSVADGLESLRGAGLFGRPDDALPDPAGTSEPVPGQEPGTGGGAS